MTQPQDSKFKPGDLIEYGRADGMWPKAYVIRVDDSRRELFVKPRDGGRGRYVKQMNAILVRKAK